jgi:hypothetical protein
MDRAAENGFKVLFPLPGDEAYLMTMSTSDMQQLIRNVVDEVGNHSALLVCLYSYKISNSEKMWVFGNELLLDDPTVTLLNGYMNYARNYTMEKWGRSVPVTHAAVDTPNTYDRLAKVRNNSEVTLLYQRLYWRLYSKWRCLSATILQSPI